MRPVVKEKENKFIFDEGVEVTVIRPNKAVVKFTPVGLAFNDLFRYIAGNSDKFFVANHEIFGTKAAEYIQSIFPTSKVKKGEDVKIDNNLNAYITVHVSEYPNHITQTWEDNKSHLEYVGPKQRTYPVGWGLGTKGGNRYLYQDESQIPEVEEKEYYKMIGKTSSLKEINKVPKELTKEVEQKYLVSIKDMLENYKYGLKYPVPVKVDVEKKSLSLDNQKVVNHIRDFLLNLRTDNQKDKEEKTASIDFENPYRLAILQKKYNKNTGKEEWALLAKSTGRVLRWYGETKPSESAVAEDEKEIHYFKSHGSEGREKKADMVEVIKEILRSKNISEEIIEEIVESYIEKESEVLSEETKGYGEFPSKEIA